MSMSHFCRAWWARWGLGSLAGGKRYHFSPGYTTRDTAVQSCTISRRSVATPPRTKKRLSRPDRLTHSGWFTHISGHPSAAVTTYVGKPSSAGQGKFAGQRPTFYHCATQPTAVAAVTTMCNTSPPFKGQDLRR